MIRHHFVRAAVALTLLGSSHAALAGVLSFSGAVTGLGVGGPDPSCDPLPFRSGIAPETTVGHSTLGDFTYSHSICLSGADGPSNGTFIMDFGTGTIQGTLDGGASPTSIEGISDVAWTYTILTGTGQFLGSTGSFMGAGTADARTRPTHVALNFAGDFSAPAVPEPASWALMILGFGAVGIVLRRARRPGISQIA